MMNLLTLGITLLIGVNPLFAAEQMTEATIAPTKKKCVCQNCKCTPEQHCGCYSAQGCKCSQNGTPGQCSANPEK